MKTDLVRLFGLDGLAPEPGRWLFCADLVAQNGATVSLRTWAGRRVTVSKAVLGTMGDGVVWDMPRALADMKGLIG